MSATMFDPGFIAAAGLDDDTDCLPASVSTAKRAFDIAVALTGLLITLPLWPLIALAIKIESPGPVIFRQLRVGRAGAVRTELFEMWKFRSMRADAEKALIAERVMDSQNP